MFRLIEIVLGTDRTHDAAIHQRTHHIEVLGDGPDPLFGQGAAPKRFVQIPDAVSYTHLTLPTSDLV